MDFYQIKERTTNQGVIEIYPDFIVGRSDNLMIQGKSFYAIWDETKGLWSTDEYDVQRLVDRDLSEHKKHKYNNQGMVNVKYLRDFSSRSWVSFRQFMNNMSDNSTQLDSKITFSNTEVTKKDFVSKRLPYPLEKGSIEAYDEIIGTLYSPEERAKIEWAVGSIIAGDSKTIQKFLVLYGEAGAGKSTILNIIQKLFEGYYITFEAKALTSSGNAFSTEVFKDNPLVAIQHDGDLSKIEDNTKLNSIVSHEEITMNEKYKPSYMARVNAFLFMATNRPVKITDAKSGIIRRLIDVKPSGNLLPIKTYQALMQRVDFELGAIAQHCLYTYRSMGKHYYDNYVPLDMILQTDIFYNYVEQNYTVFRQADGVSLTQAYEMYKAYCDEAMIEYKMARHRFREELKSYFNEFHNVVRIEGRQVRSYYSGFKSEKFTEFEEDIPLEHASSLTIDTTDKVIEDMYGDAPAQYANKEGTPTRRWDEVETELNDIDVSKLHYVRLPEKHIVIDFDITDDTGKKSLEKNLEAASKWPATYAEFSRSGLGIHLHYIYEGDTSILSRVYDDEIEIKVFTGKSSLRRQFTRSNGLPVVAINSGLPTKGEKMINDATVQSEMALRRLIKRNLNKEIHPATKPSVDFIFTILEDAYKSELVYDVTDMRPQVLTFALNSTNQSEQCLKTVNKMKFKSEVELDNKEDYESDLLVFFDVEVFPNLLQVVWKAQGDTHKPVVMNNPTSSEIEQLLKMKLVGFNCRRYDNHILYARYIGYNNEQIFDLSQKIISNNRNAFFREAYNLSYTDIYDFSMKKQSLSKFQIELGLKHLEFSDYSWDEPVPEEEWGRVAEYCINDVISTEAVFNNRSADFNARLILAELSGLTANDTTQRHTAAIIFGKNNRFPQKQFKYRDLSGEFPGYEYSFGKSTYKGEEVGEGGYVYAEPGMYTDVALLDIASMHPRSAIVLDLFGPYTKNFEDLVEARLAIKHREYDKARKMLDGKLKPFLENEDMAEGLSNSLKIAINIVYGLTAANFDNPFKDDRNVDNIVAKRGALFMVNLKEAVQAEGYSVAHIKTDSIKIPNADSYIIEFITDYGKHYGYTFEHEDTFQKMALVNDAVYIAKDSAGEWTATGAQFAHPYVFKTLFSKEKIEFNDMVETKAVTTTLYLNMNEKSEKDNMIFVGKVGAFCPIKPGHGGGVLLREKDGKYHAATGSKGYRWLEANMVKELNKEDSIDKGYFNKLVDGAIDTLAKFGDVEQFRE